GADGYNTSADLLMWWFVVQQRFLLRRLRPTGRKLGSRTQSGHQENPGGSSRPTSPPVQERGVSRASNGWRLPGGPLGQILRVVRGGSGGDHRGYREKHEA